MSNIIQFSTLGKQPGAGQDRSKPPAPQPLIQSVVYDGFDFAIRFAYFEGSNVILKSYQGQYFHQKANPWYRYWKLKKQVIEEHAEELLLALCGAANGAFVENLDSFLTKIEAAKIAPRPSAFVGHLEESIYPLEHGGVALIGTYHPGVVALAKNMHGRYLPPMKAWKLANTSPVILKNNLMTELGLRDEQVKIHDGVYSIVEDALFQAKHEDDVHIQTSNNAIPESVEAAEEGDADVYLAVTSPLRSSNITLGEVEHLLAKYELYDFQGLGVMHLVRNSSALLADDMGLGKSRQAVVAADILHTMMAHDTGHKLLVACPASLIINWSREIAMIDPGSTISLQGWDESAKWIVVNYERLEDLVQYSDRFLVMITDEAHLLKEPTTKRTRLAFDIASKVPYRFILTGTPILNRECEIHTLLRLSGHPVGNTSLREFEKEFAGNPQFRAQLNKRISEWMLRRKKDVVLKSLKGKQRQLQYVGTSDELRAEYDRIARDASLTALPKINKLRQTLEMIKVESVLEMVAEMQAEDKVLIFCEFKETVAALKQRLNDAGVGAVSLVGTDSNTKRQKAIDAFQENPEIRAFVGTTLAAGVGINLTAANYVIFASLPWTPALKEQAEDRAYRIGQKRLVIVKIPMMENSIDVDLWEMLVHKQGIADDILEPGDIEQAEQAAMEAYAQRLAA